MILISVQRAPVVKDYLWLARNSFVYLKYYILKKEYQKPMKKTVVLRCSKL